MNQRRQTQNILFGSRTDVKRSAQPKNRTLQIK